MSPPEPETARAEAERLREQARRLEAAYWWIPTTATDDDGLAMRTVVRLVAVELREVARALLAEREAAPSPLWQPIETYEGNDYAILWSPAHGLVIGAHVVGDVWHLVGVGAITSASERPTHWRRRPDPPEGASVEELSCDSDDDQAEEGTR